MEQSALLRRMRNEEEKKRNSVVFFLILFRKFLFATEKTTVLRRIRSGGQEKKERAKSFLYSLEKSPFPMRTIVAPSSSAITKSLLIPIEHSVKLSPKILRILSHSFRSC